MKDIIRWGMIGRGNVAETKSGPAFQKADNSSLQFVMSREKFQTEDFARRHNVKHWTVKADELISSKKVDAIYVATPPDSHLHYAKMVAKSGKNLLMEKPLARNFTEAQELINCCHEAGITLFVAYYRRALPRFLIVKEWIDSKKISNFVKL